MSEQPQSDMITIPIGDNQPYSQLTYSPQDFVGRGELGAVYKGSADGQAVVVKVPHTLAKNRQAEEEYAILTAIAKQLQLPNSVKVEPLGAIASVKHDEKTLIVMPYYENKDRLLDMVKGLLNEKKALEAERVALEAAIHYTQVMQAIHSIPASDNPYINGPRSCTDRKIKDYYVVDGQHYILDWNVLREEAEPFRVAEIKLFGFLWHELFFGGKGKAPFDPFDDRKWMLAGYEHGVISVGLRVLMARAVACDSAKEFNGADIARLGRALTLWRDLLTQKPPAGETAISEMLGAFDGNPPASDEVVTAIQNDLMWRLGQSTDVSARAESLKIARESLQQGDEWLNAILDRLERDGAKTELPPAPDNAPLTSVHEARWQTLLELLKEAEGLVEKGDMRFFQRDEVRQAVTTIGRLLHRAPSDDDDTSLKEVEAALNKIRANMPDESKHRQAVVAELDARQAALPFNSETQWRLAGRIEAVKELIRIFTGYYAPLLDDITQETLLPSFKGAVEKVNNGDDTRDEADEADEADKADKAYYELQAWADVIGEGRLLREQVSPWLDVLDFHRAYRHKTITHDLNTLKDVLHRWQLMQSAAYTEFHDGLKATVELYVKAAVDYLNDNIGKRTELATVNATAALLEKHKERFDVNSTLHARVKNVSDFFSEWDNLAITFIANPSPTTAKALLEKLEELKEQKDIPMSELFITTKKDEQLKAYRELLQKMIDSTITSALEKDIQGALEKLNEESELAKRIQTLKEDATTAETKVEKAVGLVSNIKQKSDEIAQKVTGVEEKIKPMKEAVEKFKTEFGKVEGLEEQVKTLKTELEDKLATKADLETVATKAELKNTNTNVDAINVALGRYFDYECYRIAQRLALNVPIKDRQEKEKELSYVPLEFNDLGQIAAEHINLINIIPVTQFTDERFKKWKQTLEDIKKFQDKKIEKKLDKALKTAEERNRKSKALIDFKTNPKS